MALTYIYIILLGLCIGSFLNVCIYRIPAKKSIVFPPSTCPNCGKKLTIPELIPVFSIIWQRGRCRGCGGRIAWRYPLVELLTGLLFLGVAIKYGISLVTLKLLFMVAALVVVTFIDMDHQIIPNVVVGPFILIGFAFGYGDLLGGLLGTLVGFGVIAAVILASRGGMGWGDAKLLGMIGAFLGWQAALYSLFVGSFFGAVFGVALIFAKKAGRKTPIPFGPFLSLGALCWIIVPFWFH